MASLALCHSERAMGPRLQKGEPRPFAILSKVSNFRMRAGANRCYAQPAFAYGSSVTMAVAANTIHFMTD